MSLAVAQRRERDAGTAQENHGDQCLCGMKAEGTMADHPDLAIESFDRPVRDLPLERASDTCPVIPQSFSESFEGLQPRSTRPSVPVLELALGDVDVPSRENRLKSFLEEIASVQGRIRPLNCGELLIVTSSEVPRIFQERPPAPLHG